MRKCLCCYEELTDELYEYHKTCAKKIFGTFPPPSVPYELTEITELAKHVVRSRFTVAGVQPKLSVEIEKATKGNTTAKFSRIEESSQKWIQKSFLPNDKKDALTEIIRSRSRRIYG